jgi:hypothetical protein
MIDTDLIVKVLRDHDHTVEAVVHVPDNAGEYEFSVDGTLLSLTETRQLLEREDAQKRASRPSHPGSDHPSAQPSEPVRSR